LQGTGTAGSLNTQQSLPVFLDEMVASTGALLQTIVLPTVANGNQRACTLTANQYAREGYPIVTVDLSNILLGCYDSPVNGLAGGGFQNTSAARVIARINANGIVDTSIFVTNVPNNMITVRARWAWLALLVK
jgi:hypothetical protein